MRAALRQLEKATRGACFCTGTSTLGLHTQAQAQEQAQEHAQDRFERQILSYVPCEPVHFALMEDSAPPLFLGLYVSSVESVLRWLVTEATDSHQAAVRAAACVRTGRVDASVLRALTAAAICIKPWIACALVASCDHICDTDVELCLRQMHMNDRRSASSLVSFGALLSALLRRLRELDVRIPLTSKAMSWIFFNTALFYFWEFTSNGARVFSALLERVVFTRSQLQQQAVWARVDVNCRARSALLEVATHPHAREGIQSLLLSFFDCSDTVSFSLFHEADRVLFAELKDACLGLDFSSSVEANLALANALTRACAPHPKRVFLHNAIRWLIKLGADHNAAVQFAFHQKKYLDRDVMKLLLEHERTTDATRGLLAHYCTTKRRSSALQSDF